MNKETVKKILGRVEHKQLAEYKLKTKGKVILITGAGGSIGTALRKRLRNNIIISTDKDTCDITNYFDLYELKNRYKNIDIVLNIAGAKHAPLGEKDEYETLKINTLGQDRLLTWFDKSHHILTSTCKSCNPETVYGATKLIADRMVMNAGGSVARFHNVIQSSGNVFEIWNKEKSHKVATKCNRYFITIDEAVGLLLFTIDNPKGRYSVNPENIRNMGDIYRSIYGEKKYKQICPRRGDRVTEKLHADNESHEKLLGGAILKITNPND